MSLGQAASLRFLLRGKNAMRRTRLMFVALLTASSAALAQVPAPPASDAEPLASIGDTPKLEVPRDEAAQDRLTAVALLAHGRMLQQRRDYAGALRRYQRAYRYDEQGRGLKEIVSLAVDLRRLDVAARYAASGGQQIRDLILLRRLALDATNRQDWALAAKLYETSLSPVGTEEARNATQVLMRAELGRLLFLSDQFQKSAASFAEVRAALAKPEDYDLSESIQKIIVGDRRQTYALMARAALEAGQYDEALALYREAHKDLPESDESQLAEASVAERRGDHELAVKLCLPVLEKGGPESSTAAEQLRRSLAQTTPADKLEATLEEKLTPAQAAHPENEALRRQLAHCRIQQGKFAEAEALLSDAAVVKPSEESLLMLATAQRQQKAADRWLTSLGKVVAATSISAVEDEARQAARDEEFSAAVLQSGGAATDEAVQAVTAVVTLEQKQYDDAERLWESSLPDDAAAKGKLLLLWGLRMSQIEQYDRAIKTFQRVIDEKLAESDPAPTWYYLSAAASAAGQNELALQAAHSARQARPKDIRFALREATVLQRAHRLAEAREKYEEALVQFDKASDPSLRRELLQTRRLLSNICLELGDHAAAIERLEEVLDEFPEDVGASNDLGYLWADRNVHLQRSLRMVQRAVDAEPENKAYRDSLGWVFFRLGRFAEAVVELEKAAAGDEPSGVILDHLGDALAQAGRRADARPHWQRALDAFRKEGNEKSAAAIEKKLSDTPNE
jgi:tetratricopeptide (TPR) repeat protein